MAQVPSNLIPARLTQLPIAPVADVNSLMLIVYQGKSYQIRVGDLLSVTGVPVTRQVLAGTGLQGGGALSSNVTLSIAPGGVGSAELAASGVAPGVYGGASSVPVFTVDATGRVTAAGSVPVVVSGYVPVARQVAAGDGLTGGGALNADVTLAADLSNTTPLVVDDTGSAGVSTAVARADHQHPAVDLSDQQQVNGVLPLDQGGTSRSLVPAEGAVVWCGADGLYVGPVGAYGQVLTSSGAGQPVWASVDVDVPRPANTVRAGPTSGADAIPTFRALVNADLPVVDIQHGGTNATTAATARANLSAAVLGANDDITSMSALSGGISTPDFIAFDTTPETVPTADGSLYWDAADGNQTLSLRMAGGNVTLQIGQETYYRIKASAPITEGQVVMFTGTVGASGALTGAPAAGLTAFQGEYVMGVATENIALNGWGYVTWFGLVRGIDTRGGAEAWTDGTILYFNPAVPGGLTKNVPSAPNAKVIVASVVHAASNGSLFVRPTFGSAFGSTDSNVQFGTLAGGDVIVYDSGNQYWKNQPQSTLSVGSATTATNVAGGAANRLVYNTAAGTSAFVVAPTVASTFLKWTGSAFAWDATGAGSGTVTSVAMSVPTGLTVTGSPITSSGTLALAFDTGYSIPTTANQTNWDTAYTDRLKWDGGSSGLTPATGRTSLGATTVGGSFFTLTNPSAITFPRINADNSVSALSAADFRTAIGAGTGGGSVTSVDASGGTTGLSFSGGPVTSSGTLTLGGTLAVASGGTGATTAQAALNTLAAATTAGYYLRGNGSNVVMSAIQAADVPTLNQNTTGNAATATLAASATNLAGGAASQLPYQTGAGATAFIANGTAGQVLTSNGASAPSWGAISGGTF